MLNPFKLRNQISALMERKRGMNHEFKLNCVWTVEQIRDGKTILKKDYKNAVTNVGKDSILDIMFNGATQITTWYLAFIDATGFSALDAGDTMASHAGWTEFTGYSQATRPEWTEDAASGQIISNSTLVQFDITASGTLKGGFLTSNNVKAGTTGTLWGTALFTGDVPVNNGDVIKITYSIQAS